MVELQSHKTAGYGWLPDLPDMRDLKYTAAPATVAALPPSVDLRKQFPVEAYRQGRIGSCTANAIAAAFEFDLIRQHAPDFVPSRLFIYYNERRIERRVGFDSGAMIRDGVKSVAKLGVCPEDEWPYDDTPPPSEGQAWPAGARAGQKPPTPCFDHARQHRVISYERVDRSLNQLKGCLAEQFPFIFGFTVYESFESETVARTGVVPMPAGSERTLGGHAVLAMGYDDGEQRFLVRNSWGPEWGIRGYFTMPYDYLTGPGARDFWTLRIVLGDQSSSVHT